MATPTTVLIRGVATTTPPPDGDLTDISSDGDDSPTANSSPTPIAQDLSIEARVWAAKVDAVQQRIKELSRIDSIYIKNTQVLNAKGKSNAFSALADSGAEVNIINRVTAKKMGLPLLNTNVGLSAIHGDAVKTYGMHYIEFQQEDEKGHVRYFQDTFLAADIDTRMILGMPWLAMANPNIDWAKKSFKWREYTVVAAMTTTCRVDLIEPEDFAELALNKDSDCFVVHAHQVISANEPSVHRDRRELIAQADIATATTVELPAEYSEYSDIFSDSGAAGLPPYGVADHAIDLVDDKQPPYGPIYNLNEVELETLRGYIETNLSNGFIRPSTSPAGSPILFVRKPGGGLRLCVDYRGLNMITIKNRYPLPLVGESIDRLAMAKRYTQLDLTAAYHRLRIKKGDEWKTAFRTRYGHFEYQVLPFGLTNAPATFQAYINQALAEKLDVFCIVYLDDILIYTQDTGAKHVEAVKWVLDKLRQHGLFVNLQKCRFSTDEVHFLGYVIAPSGVSMEEDRIQSVKNWPTLKSVREIQVFLGFANFYRRFIKGFSRIAAPLTELTKTSPSRDRSSFGTALNSGVGTRADRPSAKQVAKLSSSRDRSSFGTVLILGPGESTSRPSSEQVALLSSTGDRSSSGADLISGPGISISRPSVKQVASLSSPRDRSSDGTVLTTQKDAVAASGGTKMNARFESTFDLSSETTGSRRRTVSVQRDAVVAFRGTRANDSKSPFVLTPEARTAFEELKTAFTTAPVLKHFNPELPIRVETDASGYAIGGILSQLHEGVWHPIAYYSRKQIPAETRYDTHDKELLAIVESFKHWRHYCEGSRQKIEVLTDHHNLKRFMSTTRLNSRQIRWAQELSRYDFAIEYRQGKSNPADPLSRIPDYEQDDGTATRENYQLLTELKHSLRGYRAVGRSVFMTDCFQMLVTGTAGMVRVRDQWSRIRAAVAREDPAGDSSQDQSFDDKLVELTREDDFARSTVEQIDAGAINSLSGLKGQPYTIADGRLYYEGKIYVPEALRDVILERYHDSPLAGHFGAEKTQALIQRKYFWPKLAKDVGDHVTSCSVCAMTKSSRHKPYGELTPLPAPTHKWKDISLDFVTGLPPSKDWRGHSYDSILVIVDRLTKMAHYIPVDKTLDAEQFAQVLIENLIRYHGLPDSIVSDRGSLFTSQFWSSLAYFLGVKRRLSTAFHPQTDGQTERQNSTMEQYLRAFVCWEQDDWVSWLPVAEFAYNNARNSTTGISPFEANLGYSPRMSWDEDVDPKSRSRAAVDNAKHLATLMGVCKEAILAAQETQATYANRHRKSREYSVGDYVWLNTKYIRTKRNRKLEFKNFGPFLITHVIGKQSYRLKLPDRWRIHNVFHVSLLEKDSSKQGEVNPRLEDMEFDEGDAPEYVVADIKDSAVFDPGDDGTPGGLYYLVHWEGYPDSEDTWEPHAGVSHLRKLLGEFHKDHPNKPTAESMAGRRPQRRAPKQPKGDRRQ